MAPRRQRQPADPAEEVRTIVEGLVGAHRKNVEGNEGLRVAEERKVLQRYELGED